jgi:hypothetical protein
MEALHSAALPVARQQKGGGLGTNLDRWISMQSSGA